MNNKNYVKTIVDILDGIFIKDKNSEETATDILDGIYKALEEHQELWNISEAADGHSFAFHGANIVRNASNYLKTGEIEASIYTFYYPLYTRDTRLVNVSQQKTNL